MTNRQRRRAEEREKAKNSRRVPSKGWPMDRAVENDGMNPEPGPIGTYISKYKYGGKSWVLLQFTQPNSTTAIVFAPDDAARFAEDVLKLASGVGIVDGEDVAEPSVVGDTGLVIAREMPK